MKIKKTQSRLIRLIGVVFSNGAVLSVSDKYDSVNECTREISELMKLHIEGAWQNAYKFIRQLAHAKYNQRTTAENFFEHRNFHDNTSSDIASSVGVSDLPLAIS